MSYSRPALLALLVVLALGTALPWRPDPERLAGVRALDFLLGRQQPDGSWRSDRYGQFRDGTALTPLVLRALLALPAGPRRDAALERGVAFLDAIPTDEPLDYPIYTAAGVVEVCTRWRPERHRDVTARWLADLRGRQLNADLGWPPDDWRFGGWGYFPAVPRKPQPGQFEPPLLESNLSATAFALSALAQAGEPTPPEAGRFVDRCRNPDGGFFFVPGDPTRNKAGGFRSYGSATADGLLALRLCGVTDGRVDAARRWLVEHLDEEWNRPVTRFYFAASLARSMPLPAHLRRDLVARQLDDGSWLNPVQLMREDEPLVATAFAVLALWG